MSSLEVIKALRERTGASLQACKKALEESNHHEETAIEILRKKGESKATDRSKRETHECVVAVAIKGSNGVILKLSCETDFVAKSPDFIAAADALARDYLEKGESYNASQTLNDLGLKMGEKIEVPSITFMDAPILGDYIHSNRKLGALIGLEGGNADMARDIAMHTTAMNPRVLSPEEVDTLS